MLREIHITDYTRRFGEVAPRFYAALSHLECLEWLDLRVDVVRCLSAADCDHTAAADLGRGRGVSAPRFGRCRG
jgi:hypothetical protein